MVARVEGSDNVAERTELFIATYSMPKLGISTAMGLSFKSLSGDTKADELS